jgi:hypothetical protein
MENQETKTTEVKGALNMKDVNFGGGQSITLNAGISMKDVDIRMKKPRDIVITMPDTKHEGIEELVRFYEKEAENGEELYFRVGRLPKDPVIGGRCFIVSNGHLIGSHMIVDCRSISETEASKLSDGKWTAGNYIIRTAASFRECKNKIPDKGHRGFRYVVDPNEGC